LGYQMDCLQQQGLGRENLLAGEIGGSRLKGGREMIVTTTPNVEGRRIVEYCGVVAGEAIMGANIVRDFMASITDVVGGRSSAYEDKLVQAREVAIQEMCARAARLGANAVVGVDLDYEVLGANNGMLMVTAAGTAVKLE
jgi:uncharacterized protein YbjQ (UPF0145 family)